MDDDAGGKMIFGIQPSPPDPLDGCPVFAPAYMGRTLSFSNAFTPSATV